MSGSLVSTTIPRAATANRPLRVLLMTQASGGGVGRHMLDLAEGLAARDVDVTGIYSPRKLDAACRQRIASGRLPPLHAFPMRRAIHPIDGPDFARLVRLIYKLGPFDVIHGHSSKGGALARLAGRALGAPVVYTPNAFVTQDPTLTRWNRWLYGRIERWLAETTAAIIAVSQDEIEHASSLGIDRRRIYLVPNGVTPPDFPDREEARTRLGFGPDDLVIGFVGRLAPQKAPDVMLDAFALARSKYPAARLVMVGSGDLERDVRSRVAALGLESCVTLLGDVVATTIMPAFDIFCLSSRYEGMPYVLIEALAAGLPIVTTRIGGATMCVEPGRNGLIVPPDDAESLAAALTTLAADPERRQRYAHAAKTIAPRYTADQMVDQTLGVYAKVLAKTRPLGARMA